MVDGVDWERWDENRSRELWREKRRDIPPPSGGEEDLVLPELPIDMTVEIDGFLEAYAPPVVPTPPQALQQLSTSPIVTIVPANEEREQTTATTTQSLKQMSNAQMETVVPASEKMERPPAKKRPNSEADLAEETIPKKLKTPLTPPKTDRKN